MAEEQTSQEATQQEQKPAATSAETKNTDTQPQEQTVPYARFKEINEKLKALEDEAAKQAKDREAEDEKKLAAQQEWQRLYEGNKAKVQELTPKAELADKLTEMVLAQYQAEIKEWPDTVKAMAPGDEATVLQKLDWMNKAKPLALELMEDKAPQAGNGRRPPPSAPAGTGAREEKSRAQHATWTRTQF